MENVVETQAIEFDLGLKDQLIINVTTAIVGLIAGKLVEKSYVNILARRKMNTKVATAVAE